MMTEAQLRELLERGTEDLTEALYYTEALHYSLYSEAETREVILQLLHMMESLPRCPWPPEEGYIEEGKEK